MKTYLAFVGLMLITLCGCMHTYVAGGHDSPDKQYTLWVISNGASGKAYVDKSKKKIWISIATREGMNSGVLFEKRYVLTGSDITWETRWLSDEAVSVVFY